MKKGWTRSRLGDVATKIGSGATPLGGEAAYKSSGTALIRSLNVHDAGFRMKDLAFIDDDQAAQLDNVRVESGDVLLNITGASVARCCVVPTNILPARVNQHVAIIRPAESRLLTRFLHYLLISHDYKSRLLGAGESGGSTRQALTKAQLQDFQIEYPATLAEQERIVRVVDEAFAGIATAQAHAEKNLQNARALFETHLQTVFAQRGVGWVERAFGDLVESNVIGLTRNSRQQGEDLQYPYVKMNNITRDNRFDFSSFTKVDGIGDEVEKFRLLHGDFLFNTRNSVELVGKACLFESGTDDIVLFNNNVMRVRFKEGVDAQFVLFSFSSRSVSKELHELKSGTTNVAAIYYKDLQSLLIPLAPHDVQRAFASKLTNLRRETQRLETIYEQKLTALAALKKSLLHQAFSGEL